jgi:uncharacterized protein YbjQ (UPF0145 family)
MSQPAPTEPTSPTAGDPYRAGFEPTRTIIVTTGNDVAGYQITGYLAIVRGIVVRATSLGKGILGGFKALGGGNIKEFSDVCEAARHDAYAQMLEHAQHAGADAIIGMRYDATEFAQGSTEVLAYGTAVKLEPLPPR